MDLIQKDNISAKFVLFNFFLNIAGAVNTHRYYNNQFIYRFHLISSFAYRRDFINPIKRINPY
jgi:predicted patatin/cPLA2 family phospholipase